MVLFDKVFENCRIIWGFLDPPNLKFEFDIIEFDKILGFEFENALTSKLEFSITSELEESCCFSCCTFFILKEEIVAMKIKNIER